MRVLVLGAGGPAGVNSCKALSEHYIIAADENKENLRWCRQAQARVHMPELTVERVNRVGADVVVPQPDRATMWAADHQDQITAGTFLPDRRTVALCQDKWEAGLAFRRAGLRKDKVLLVDSGAADYDRDALPSPPFWLRARHGAGAKAAILARSHAEAKHWLAFWNLRDTYMDFLIEGHLPGRDLAWSSIWFQGNLVASFCRERLEYIYPSLTPEGLTGTPTRARIVHDVDANLMAVNAVLAVDAEPHGIFSVDMREDADGVPRPTEINAGRGFTTFGLWAMQTEPNLMERVVRFASGETAWRNGAFDCIPEGVELRRHIDCGSMVYYPTVAA